MHRNRFSWLLLLSAAPLLGAAPLMPAHAQTGAVALKPEVSTRSFELHNVKPSLVAYWLDPSHHLTPIEIRMAPTFDQVIPSNSTVTSPRLPGNANGPVGLALPAGVQEISAIDAQSALFATGTKEGLDAMGKLLPTLDVPLVQYEVEAQFCRLSRTDLSILGLKFEALPGESEDNFGAAGVLPPDSLMRLHSLPPKHLVLLDAPRIMIIDGLSGELKQTTTVGLGLSETPAPAPPRFAVAANSGGIKVGVTRLPNGLIEVAVEPHYGSRTVSVTALLADEQPFVIRMSPATDARQLIVVVNIRRVRRAGD